MPALQPFTIDFTDELLDDLRQRLRVTRWPPSAPDRPWRQGTDIDYLRDLVACWADGFDWRAQERRLNSFAQYLVALDGIAIHVVHVRAPDGAGIPLMLTHGWPSTFLEYLPLVPRGWRRALRAGRPAAALSGLQRPQVAP